MANLNAVERIQLYGKLLSKSGELAYYLDIIKYYVHVLYVMTEFHTTKQAALMRSGVNLQAEITKISPTRTVNIKQGGTVNIADTTLTNEAGDIALALWGDDINAVKVGNKITITNGYTKEFKGQVSLTKGKFSKLEVE